MEGTIRNLWEVRSKGMRATLDRDGKSWRVKVTSGNQTLTEESFQTISHAQQAFDTAADAVNKKK